jgi:hypothetical protein
MRYKRSSSIAGHFLSPKFRPFETKSEFFNTHALLTTTLNFRQRKLCLTLQSDSLEFRHKGRSIVPALSLTSKQCGPRLILGDRDGHSIGLVLYCSNACLACSANSTFRS